MKMTNDELTQYENDHKFYQSILKHSPEINKDLKDKFQMRSMIYQYEVDKRNYEERIRMRKIFWLLFFSPIAIVIIFIFFVQSL
jgi:hypothetical protein